MISAPVGSTFAVIGSNNATVNAGPIPGRTPMAVPSKQPMKPHIRLIGVSAAENPIARLARMSKMSISFGPSQIQALTSGGRETPSPALNSQ
ncbi:hypothetical protein D3C73_389540 [compost metagenome]